MTGGVIDGWAGLATAGPTGAADAVVGVTGATCIGASIPMAGACGRPGGGAGA